MLSPAVKTPPIVQIVKQHQGAIAKCVAIANCIEGDGCRLWRISTEPMKSPHAWNSDPPPCLFAKLIYISNPPVPSSTASGRVLENFAVAAQPHRAELNVEFMLLVERETGAIVMTIPR